MINIKKIFEKHFYKDSYKLIKIWYQEGTGHEHYAIIDITGVTGVVVEFSVSPNYLYEASSNGNLLNNIYRLRHWIEFLEEVNDELNKTKKR